MAKSKYNMDMLSDDYEWKPDNFIESDWNKKVSKAWNTDIEFAQEVSKKKGYHYDLATAAKELFKPITDTNLQSEKSKTLDSVREDIFKDPDMPADQKLVLTGKIDKIKLEKYTSETTAKKTPEEQRRDEVTNAIRLQNDTLFGIVSFKPDSYIFGIARFIFGPVILHKEDREPSNMGHQLHIDTENGRMFAAMFDGIMDEPVTEEFPYSKDIITLLTLNTIEVSSQTKHDYMKLIDFCLGKELVMLGGIIKDIQRSGNTKDYHDKALDVIHRLKDNVKWVNWISVKYKIPLRIQPDRSTKSGQKYTSSADATFGSADDDDSDGGKGFFLSPHANERTKRAFVLLGHKRSAKEDNPDALNEFTSILDSLLAEKTLDIKRYKKLVKEYNK